MSEKEVVDELMHYYEVDIDNCLMSHTDWIKELAKAITDKNYLDKLKEELNIYNEEREVDDEDEFDKIDSVDDHEYSKEVLEFVNKTLNNFVKKQTKR